MNAGCITAAGATVAVVDTAHDVETGAPGWVATCDGCGWTSEQYACWHELWPAYPTIAGTDVRGLLLDEAAEHAAECQTAPGGAR